jgi:hypothetical protein
MLILEVVDIDKKLLSRELWFIDPDVQESVHLG